MAEGGRVSCEDSTTQSPKVCVGLDVESLCVMLFLLRRLAASLVVRDAADSHNPRLPIRNQQTTDVHSPKLTKQRLHTKVQPKWEGECGKDTRPGMLRH